MEIQPHFSDNQKIDILAGSFLLAQWFGASGVYLCRKKEKTMFEIIITVGLYIGALALLVKGAITFCNTCQE